MLDSEDFPPNSRKSKAGEPETRVKVDRVTKADAVRPKKSLGSRFVETFIGGDPKTAAHAMVAGVLIPQAKDMIVEMVIQGVERLILGEPRRRSSATRPGGLSNYTTYGASARRGRTADDRPPNPLLSKRSRETFDFEELAVQTRPEAEEVLQNLYALLEKYDSVTVDDFYRLLGVESKFTDQKWGWTDLRGSGVRRLRDGTYLIDLPQPESLTR